MSFRGAQTGLTAVADVPPPPRVEVDDLVHWESELGRFKEGRCLGVEWWPDMRIWHVLVIATEWTEPRLIPAGAIRKVNGQMWIGG